MGIALLQQDTGWGMISNSKHAGVILQLHTFLQSSETEKRKWSSVDCERSLGVCVIYIFINPGGLAHSDRMDAFSFSHILIMQTK